MKYKHFLKKDYKGTIFKNIMKIALLNLPIDSNYGGNLQRYALIKTLEKLGHDVTFVRVYFRYEIPFWKRPLVILKRIIKRCMFNDQAVIFNEKKQNERLEQKVKYVDEFINKHIQTTKSYTPLDNLKELNKEGFECFVVGSDQVWRASMAKPIAKYFLNFVKNDSILKVAYAASFGNNTGDYKYKQIIKCKKLIKKFDAISVRESEGINLLRKYWGVENVECLLDPCFLLKKSDYVDLFQQPTNLSKEKFMFCYVLDANEEKTNVINSISKSRGLKKYSINKDIMAKGNIVEGCSVGISIEDWLQAIYFAKYIVTDSYHGTIFSIIFNKPFKVFYNKRRGNERFKSLFSKLRVNPEQSESFDWEKVNEIIEAERLRSLSFLCNLPKIKM